MTDKEKRNLERVKLWEETWNGDVMRMVDELYAENCEVRSMFYDFVIRGREELRQVEKMIQQFARDRRMRIYRTVASGDVVALEADSFIAGKQYQASVFLTFDENGMITSDHTYGTDPTGATSS